MEGAIVNSFLETRRHSAGREESRAGGSDSGDGWCAQMRHNGPGESTEGCAVCGCLRAAAPLECICAKEINHDRVVG
eukprot:2965087-Rhodomonas_salina.1